MFYDKSDESVSHNWAVLNVTYREFAAYDYS